VLVEHGSAEQVQRWVRPGLLAQQSWCQLFSEPGAGSDAAAVETKARRVEGGWVVNGQKIWTSGAKEAAFGLATVRTDLLVAKHAGITMLAIDMRAPGVEVRPLRQISGPSEFNEVFLTDVFVSDEQQIGATGAGWTVARSTFGNERSSIGSGLGRAGQDIAAVVAAFDAAGKPQRAVERIGRYLARSIACTMVNARQTERAVAGAEPGPEGNVTKLVASENTQWLATLLADLADPGEVAAAEPGTAGGDLAIALLASRMATIAGGTAEIVRNQIAERILGLPRDPLIR
jgi:alkylation response protein AidB-like acyl-CoA dehydrogenase